MIDSNPDGIENATHNTFPKLTWIFVFDLKTIKHGKLCSFLNFDINVIRLVK
jgi:hypothetical protein